MLYTALLHYPVYNKNGQVVTTSIANMDIHDIVRLSKTYGIENYFLFILFLPRESLPLKLLITGEKAMALFLIRRGG
jgi:hypothetical protein